MKIYADRLKQLLKENKLTQAELAKNIGISQNAIHNYTAEKREPKLEIAKRIADYFGVSVDYMLRSDEEFSASHDSKWKNNLMDKFSKVV